MCDVPSIAVFCSESIIIIIIIIIIVGWTVRGSNPGRRRDFQYPSRPTLGPTQPLLQWLLVLYPGGKAVGAWR